MSGRTPADIDAVIGALAAMSDAERERLHMVVRKRVKTDIGLRNMLTSVQNAVKNTERFPRLSVQLRGPKHPLLCQRCSGSNDLRVWSEADDNDNPALVNVVLCKACEKALVKKHPRLYHRVAEHAPRPGVMPVCVLCRFREGVSCTHPDGAAVPLRYPKPFMAMIDGHDKRGRSIGWTERFFTGPVTCERREEWPAGDEAGEELEPEVQA